MPSTQYERLYTMTNVSLILHENARRSPDAAALRIHDREMTYGELDRAARRTSAFLRSINIGAGQRAGLCLRDGVDSFVLMFALAHVGAPFLLMDGYSRPGEITDLVDALSLDVVIMADKSFPLPDIPVHRLDGSWREAVARCEDSAGDPASGSTGFIINTSSGTTGKPKGLVVSHTQYCRRWRSTSAAVGWSSGERHLCLGRLGFSGARNSCLFHLLSGNSVVLGPHLYSLDELVRWVREYGITSVFAAPAMLRTLLSGCSPPTGHLIPEVGYLWLTGGATSVQDKVLIRKYLCEGIYDEYGASGFGTISCLTPEHTTGMLGSVGRPVEGVRVEIVDGDFRALPAGALGRIRCKGPHMSCGFENDSNSQGYEFFREGWFYPGDMGYTDADGFLYIQGRATDLIIRGGVNIYPEEIERVLCQHPAVKDAAVVGTEDPVHGERVLAWVTLRSTCSGADLINHCRKHLSGHKVPDAFRFTEQLPRTDSGKVRRNALAEMAEAGRCPDIGRT